MLKRAIFISAVLHLLILSLGVPDFWRQSAAAGKHTEALNMVIAERSVGESSRPVAHKVDAERKAGLPFVPRNSDLNFGHFLPSTVGMTKSGDKKHQSAVLESPVASPSVSTAELSEYRLSVARSARQFKVYPALARDKGWEGVVHVAVSLPSGLAVPVVFLGSSSGHAVLDRQALDMIAQAISQTRLPETLRGKILTISLPVEYRLAD